MATGNKIRPQQQWGQIWRQCWGPLSVREGARMRPTGVLNKQWKGGKKAFPPQIICAVLSSLCRFVPFCASVLFCFSGQQSLAPFFWWLKTIVDKNRWQLVSKASLSPRKKTVSGFFQPISVPVTDRLSLTRRRRWGNSMVGTYTRLGSLLLLSPTYVETCTSFYVHSGLNKWRWLASSNVERLVPYPTGNWQSYASHCTTPPFRYQQPQHTFGWQWMARFGQSHRQWRAPDPFWNAVKLLSLSLRCLLPATPKQ